jgi:hypothetical protein
MPACEKCWTDAYSRMLANPDRSQVEHYVMLLAERAGNPCVPRERRGGVGLRKDGMELKTWKRIYSQGYAAGRKAAKIKDRSEFGSWRSRVAALEAEVSRLKREHHQ